MLTSALFGAKNVQIFRNLWCDRTDKKGGLSQCGNIANKGRKRDSFNAILCGPVLLHLLLKNTFDRKCVSLTPALTLKRNNVLRTDEMTSFIQKVYRYRVDVFHRRLLRKSALIV